MESQNMCFGCPSFCCRISAAITTYDILRIAGATGKPVNEFVQYCPVDKKALGFKALNSQMEFYLKRERDSCVFLRGRPQAVCTIEDFKPGVCLTYPFSFRDGEVSLRTDALCPPHNKRKADFDKMSSKALDDCQYELDIYVEIIDDWNEMAKGDEKPEEFLDFSIKELDLNQKPIFGPHLRRARSSLRKILKKRS
jgi:Fe-S-cluster containining protein